MNDFIHYYSECTKRGLPPQAAAMLVLAKQIDDSVRRLLSNDELSHQICMGIRHGIFGDGSPQSIGSLDEIANAIQDAK